MLGLLLAGLAWRYALFLWSGRAGGLGEFIEAHCVWDCTWYSSIIDAGYQTAVGTLQQPERANWAFFPLYPMLAGIIVHVFGATPPIAGFILSNGAIAVTAVVARPLLGSARAYWFFVAALLIGPFSVLFSSLYTESLFILLTVLAVLALRRSNYLAAAGWICLLSATRINGVLMVFALAAQIVVDHRQSGGRWRDLPLAAMKNSRIVLAIVLAPLGLFAFMAFLWFHTGDALAFSHIQRSWGREFEGPISAIGNVIAGGLSLEYFSLLRWSWVVAAGIGLALTGVLAARKRWPEALFCGLSLLVALSTGVGSMVRFVAGLAPLGMVMSDLLSRSQWLAWPALAASFALGSAATLGWFNGSMFVM